MRASISTIGPPYGTWPLLHAPSRRRVSFMLQDSGSLQAHWPQDQLFLIQPGLVTKEDFLCADLLFFFWSTSPSPSDPLCWSRWSAALPLLLEMCARTMIVICGDIYLHSSFEPWMKESPCGFLLSPVKSHNTSTRHLFIYFSPPNLTGSFFCGAFEGARRPEVDPLFATEVLQLVQAILSVRTKS